MIGIYGGTFDPVHYGHLRLAEELVETIGLQTLRFIPAGLPRLRNAPNTSSLHRAAMLQVAIQGNDQFLLDEREVNRLGESHSVVSLRELKDEIEENSALCFVMGVDVFIRFSEWYDWRELFDLCHLIIVERPGYLSMMDNDTLPDVLQKEFMQRQVTSVSDLRRLPSGCIFVAATTLLDISASAIRNFLLAGKSTRYLLPDAVLEYIRINQLYSSGAE